MKLSDTAMTILKNFYGINESIVIKPGNTIATVAPKGKAQIMAVATVPDSFMNTLAIGDLGQFIGCLSLFNEPDLTIHDQYVTINQGNTQIRYTFCEERAVTVPTKTEIPIPNPVASLDISASDMKALSRSAGLLKTPEYRITAEFGKVIIKTCDSKNPSGNEYTVFGPETDNTFDFLVDKDSITGMLDRDYAVTVADNGIARFVSKDLTYYIVGKAQR